MLSEMLRVVDTETGQKIPDQQIIDEALTFLFAGHDTTTDLLSWTMLILCENPEYQIKLQKEVDTVLAGNQITQENLQNLKLCKATLLETLRLYPAVPRLSRTALKDIEMCGKFIPKGTSASINIMGVHYNPIIFPEPNKFRAERFLEDRDSSMSYSFTPFSAGTRNCIGQKLALQEAIITLATLMQNFNVELFDSNIKVRTMCIATLTPINLYLKFTLRK